MNRSYPALRGIAILLVILNHSIHMTILYAGDLNPWIKTGPVGIVLSALSALGFAAVPIFLFLSGSFFAYAASRDDLRANYRVVWVNLKHVAIPYLIWSLVFYASLYVFHDTRYSIAGYIKNLLVGYPYNFVPLLIFFYLVSPLLVRLFRLFGWWLIAFIAIYQLFLLLIVNSKDIGLALPGIMEVAVLPVLGVPLAQWAVYFPLGLISVLRSVQMQSILTRVRWLLVLLTVFLFGLGLLDGLGVIQMPLFRYLVPVPFILFCTTLQRSSIPKVRTLETIGKRAYGLYLTNLLVLDLALLGVQAAFPGALTYPLVLMPLAYAAALFIPMAVMSALERRMKPIVFRYAFG